MSTPTKKASRSWSAGRYTVTLTMHRPKAGALVQSVVSWVPEQPRRLTEGEIADYTRGRNKALIEISQELGINAAVVL